MDNHSTYSFIVGLVWGAVGDRAKDEKKINVLITNVSDQLGIRLNPIDKEDIEQSCFKIMRQCVKNMVTS